MEKTVMDARRRKNIITMFILVGLALISGTFGSAVYLSYLAKHSPSIVKEDVDRMNEAQKGIR